MKLKAFSVLVAGLLLSSASALAGGWYLMAPPTEAELDTTCRAGASPAWGDYWAASRDNWTAARPNLRYSAAEARLRRCLAELYTLAPDAPLSNWIQLRGPDRGLNVSVYKGIDDCNTALGLGRRPGPAPVDQRIFRYADKVFLKLTTDMENDPAFKDPVLKKDPKDLDTTERQKTLRLLNDFETRHPDEAVLVKALYPEYEGSENIGSEKYEQCVATEDPRLNTQLKGK